MIMHGRILNGAIVPDEPLPIAEGTAVRVDVLPEFTSTGGVRQGGWWRGQVAISPDFDELPPDIASAFGH